MMSALMDAAWLKPERRKLRRKLQKLDSHPNSSHVTSTDGVEHWVPETRRSFFRSRRPSKCESVGPGVSVGASAEIHEKPCLPLPSPPSVVAGDSDKKQQQTGQSARSREGPPPVERPASYAARPSTSQSDQPIPEFAHLRSGGRTSQRLGRNNSMAVRPLSLPPTSSTGPRRYAKTPVSRIGQLESSASLVREEGPQKVPSIERIADSYRALVEPYNTIFGDADADANADVPELGQPSLTSNSTPSLDGMPSTPSAPSTETIIRHDHVAISGSPRSDAGTLVGFDDDGMYGRPVPHTPDSPPAPLALDAPPPTKREPRLRRSTGLTARPARNPRLEISLDLLTQELASAVRGMHWRPGSETSALQIWVMIEAYEKLRDQLQESQQQQQRRHHHQHYHHHQNQTRNEEQAPLEMFDMWLKALHRIHDQMTGAHGHLGESG